MIRAVTLSRPVAEAVATGGLTVFTRPWRSPWRGRTAIHYIDPDTNTRGIVATATLTDVVRHDTVAWVPDDKLVKVVVTKAVSVLPVSQASLLSASGAPLDGWLYILTDVTPTGLVECNSKGGGMWAVDDAVEALCVASAAR